MNCFFPNSKYIPKSLQSSTSLYNIITQTLQVYKFISKPKIFKCSSLVEFLPWNPDENIILSSFCPTTVAHVSFIRTRTMLMQRIHN